MKAAWRDPRKNPQPGDKLKTWFGGRIPRLRSVTSATEDVVEYNTATGRRATMSLTKWIADMRNAVVLEFGRCSFKNSKYVK